MAAVLIVVSDVLFQGEYLQIPHDGCCPECVGTLAPCQYDSKTVPVSSIYRVYITLWTHTFNMYLMQQFIS